MAVREIVQTGEQAVEQVVVAERQLLHHGLAQAVLAEEGTLGGAGLGRAVGIQQQHVARGDIYLPVAVLHVGKRADYARLHVERDELACGRMHEDRRGVAG